MCVGLWGALSLGCKGSDGGPPAPAASGSSTAAPAAATGPAPAVAKTEEGCLASLDYLVPPQKYPDGDLIRAVLVDGDQVFFRNMRDLLRVPLAGGAITTVGPAPSLSLRGTTELWQAGDELVMQSPGEPIFMKAKKTGGAWASYIDLTAAKRGGGRDAATRILQGIGGPSVPSASQAAFDGRGFFYGEVTRGKGRDAAATSKLESVPFTGGEAHVLFTTPGEISEVTRVADQVVFHLILPPTAEQVKAAEEERKKNKFAFRPSGENWVMAVPVAGGEAKRLMRLGSIFSGGLMGTSTILGADGTRLYLSGYADEDPMKPGIYRVEVTGGAPEQLDKRFVRGTAYVAGERVVIVGSGVVEPGKSTHGSLVLTLPRDGKSVTLASCVADKSSLHATAVAGNVVLLSLFQPSTSTAAIAKVPLP